MLINVKEKREKIVYISRHGQSEMNVKDIIGGNGYLSPSGVEYSEKLGDYIANNIDTENTRFVTSSMNRTRQTAKLAGVSPEQNEDLDEIDAGDFDGLSYGEVKCRFPSEYEARKDDKLNYRYPNGESYVDLLKRTRRALKSVDFENFDNFLIIHQAVARCLIAIMLGLSDDKVPQLEIPLHKVIKIQGSEITYQKLL